MFFYLLVEKQQLPLDGLEELVTITAKQPTLASSHIGEITQTVQTHQNSCTTDQRVAPPMHETSADSASTSCPTSAPQQSQVTTTSGDQRGVGPVHTLIKLLEAAQFGKDGKKIINVDGPIRRLLMVERAVPKSYALRSVCHPLSD